MTTNHFCARALLAMLLLFATPNIGAAAELLRVGKSVPEAFSFVPLDVGMRVGLFRKYGVAIEASSLSGGARLQQALAADSIDIGLGSGPEMAAIQKGSPVRAVAAMAGAPRLLALLVRPDGAVKSIADLRAKKIGVTTVNSLTAWLVSELSRQQGWGPNGIDVTPLGATPAQFAALKTGQIDGLVADIATLLQAEANGYGKILFRFGDLVKDFHIHVIFASDKVIASRPDAVRAFLKAWFETIAFMRDNKATTVRIAARVDGTTEALIAREYDLEVPKLFSPDGRFSAAGLNAIRDSLVPLQMVEEAPDMSKLYTEAFLPNPAVK
jgi:NitT/TauT family transport system substrate-binding protein